MKAAALIGLSLAVTGVSAAKAATISQTDTFSLSRSDSFAEVSFAQFNPSLGTLTHVELSLISSLSAAPLAADADIFPDLNNPNLTIGVTTTAAGPFDFTITGLQQGLTTVDYTGSGDFPGALFLNDGPSSAIWSGNGPGQGLTLTYDYTPAMIATPLPATLPLFASGLGGLGLFGWHRKRKARAA